MRFLDYEWVHGWTKALLTNESYFPLELHQPKDVTNTKKTNKMLVKC